jgi:hypothetical protein
MALGQILGLAGGVARLAGDLLQPIQALIALSHPLDVTAATSAAG